MNSRGLYATHVSGSRVVSGRRTQADNVPGSDESSDGAEVFYDHRCDPFGEVPPAEPSHSLSDRPSPQRRAGEMVPFATVGVLQDERQRARSLSQTSVGDDAVTTVDHMVCVPTALRGASRRTMFDVLHDLSSAHPIQDPAQRQAPTEMTDVVPNYSETSKSAEAATRARTRTYQMLFPPFTTSLASTEVPAPAGFTVIATPDASGSGPAATPAATKACGGGSASHGMLDRRLRHLLPRHLRGKSIAHEDEENVKTADTSKHCTVAVSSWDHQGDPRGARCLPHMQDVSDISSISSDEVEVGYGARASQCGGSSSSLHVPRSVLHPPRRCGARTEHRGPLAKLIDGKADAIIWEAGQRQGRRAEINLRRQTAVTDEASMGRDLLRHAHFWPVDLSATPAAGARGRKADDPRRTRHREGRSSPCGASTTDDETSRGNSLGGSPKRKMNVVELEGDLNEDVPRWVRRREVAYAHVAHPERENNWFVPRLHPSTAALRGAAATEWARTRKEATDTAAATLQVLLGKPPVFYPSSTALRKSSSNLGGLVGDASALQVDAEAHDPITRYQSSSRDITVTVLTTKTTAAATTARTFQLVWREGKQLVKQRASNPTAVAVMEYVWQRFQRWRPCGARLLRRLRLWTGLVDEVITGSRPKHTIRDSGEASFGHEGFPNRGGLEELIEETADGCDSDKADRCRNTDPQNAQGEMIEAQTESDAVSTTDGEGVDLQISVDHMMCAFNVVVVHGKLVWASASACTRLGITPPRPLHDAHDAPAATATEALPCAGWKFLFPEPALMRLPVRLHEHLYIGSPYSVFPDIKTVLSSYNFTTDAFLRQQEKEEEEALAPPAPHNGPSEDGAGEVPPPNSRKADGGVWGWGDANGRQRAVSPTRGLSSDNSEVDRMPEREGIATAVTPMRGSRRDHSPPLPMSIGRRSYGEAGPEETEHTPILKGPVGGTVEGVSPAPLPPVEHRIDARRGTQEQAHYPLHNAAPTGTPAAPSPGPLLKSISPSSTTARASTADVNSIAREGFYDPLAMPALSTAVRRGAAATALHPKGSAEMTNSATTASEHTRLGKQPETAFSIEGATLPIPPPLSWERGRGATRSDVSEYPSVALGVRSTRQTLSGMADIMVGTEEAAARGAFADGGERIHDAVDGIKEGSDRLGVGFPRGPAADWDVPIEVLVALNSGGAMGSAKQEGLQDVPSPGYSHGLDSKEGSMSRGDTATEGERESGDDGTAALSRDANLSSSTRRRSERQSGFSVASGGPSIKPAELHPHGDTFFSSAPPLQHPSTSTAPFSFPTPQSPGVSAGSISEGSRDEGSLVESISSAPASDDEEESHGGSHGEERPPTHQHGGCGRARGRLSDVPPSQNKKRSQSGGIAETEQRWPSLSTFPNERGSVRPKQGERKRSRMSETTPTSSGRLSSLEKRNSSQGGTSLLSPPDAIAHASPVRGSGDRRLSMASQRQEPLLLRRSEFTAVGQPSSVPRCFGAREIALQERHDERAEPRADEAEAIQSTAEFFAVADVHLSESE